MNPHKILGISPNASLPQAKEAWQKAVRENHPDRHPEKDRPALNEKILLINKAWKTLQSTQKTKSNTGEQNDRVASGNPSKRQEFVVPYGKRNAAVAELLKETLETEIAAAKKRFWSQVFSSLPKGKLPKSQRISVNLCGGVVVENGVMRLVFYAPLSKGTNLLVYPKVMRGSTDIRLVLNQVQTMRLTLERAVAGTYSPFSTALIKKEGFEDIIMDFPDEVLDIAKSFVLPPKDKGNFYFR